MCRPSCWSVGRCWLGCIGSLSGGMKWLGPRLEKTPAQAELGRGTHLARGRTERARFDVGGWTGLDSFRGRGRPRHTRGAWYERDTVSEDYVVAGDCVGDFCAGYLL